MNLPEKYTESMKMMLGDEYDSYIESFNDKRLYGLRVNNLKISTEDFLKICPFKLEPVPWIENGFYYSEDDKPAKHPYYFAGLYYIQELFRLRKEMLYLICVQLPVANQQSLQLS